MKLVLAILAVSFLALTLVPAPAEAVCTVSGYASRAFVPTGAGAASYIIEPGAGSAAHWIVFTVDADIIGALNGAVSNHNRVVVQGAVAACPAPAALASIGLANYVYVNP